MTAERRAAPAWKVGEEVETLTLPPVTRLQLIKYAGASGDFNPIHTIDEAAERAGLKGVIAHGMYTMALAARAVDTWAGGPGRIREIGCKFTRAVVVPDDDEGVVVRVAGTVKEVTDDTVQVTLEVTCGGERVLGMPKAVLAR